MSAVAPPPYDTRQQFPTYGTYQQVYQPAPPQITTNVVLVNQPQPVRTVPIVYTRFGESPTPFKCQYCNTQQVSNVSQEPSSMAWLLALILCAVGLWPFCVIPFCISSFYDVIHTCPNCNTKVGMFRRS